MPTVQGQTLTVRTSGGVDGQPVLGGRRRRSGQQWVIHVIDTVLLPQ